MAACVLAMLPVHAQVSTPFNNGLLTDFVGWDNTMVNDPLQIRHDANQPIEFHTAMDERMRLSPILTGQTINTYPNLDLTGFLGSATSPTAPEFTASQPLVCMPRTTPPWSLAIGP